ncbi:hypothetical protein CKY39_16110 [Variovorax boronicumulans]|uniref:Deoxynucleotide monophosphate kinase n=1 Tax=Variovorax boronicumulans TaxID=436515 RepID=A0A250DJY1_9BURK|nr:hypothetical protein [Variovorax boronicumulans]ATA54562.1 hypothetical protein CKY39_16110 [Variovorax boronicumulans]
MKKHVIALTGYAAVGKDTVADLLVEHLGFRKLAFADTLRGEVANAFGVELSYLVHPSTKNHPMSALAMRRAPVGFLAAAALAPGLAPRDGADRIAPEWLDQPRSPRQIMQWWGTEYRRREHEHYWSRQLVKRALDYMHHGETRFVITDCRFDNEAKAVRDDLGGQIWQITRPGIDSSTTAEGAHVSATDGSGFAPDVVLSNSHDIRHLQQLVLGEFLSHEAGIAGATVAVPQ